MRSDIYQKKLDSLVAYFRSGETKSSEFKLGLEVEHFVVDSNNLKAAPYYGSEGIEGILKCLEKKGWQGIYENKKILGLKGEYADISLEPGGQLEISLQPLRTINEIKSIYIDFLEQAVPIIRSEGNILLTVGYQPESSIDELELLPKERYTYMYNYFKNKGEYAYNMMKGTASIQLNLDYCSEENFRKKMRVAYFLSPLIYFFFDNAPFFEGELCRDKNIRAIIWDNCDMDRCGFIESVFNENFGYQDYAEYILNTPAIITRNGDELTYVGSTAIKDVYGDTGFTEGQVEHLLSMVFPDVRLKKFIEIRMGDSLPYPYCLSYAVLWKGLLYNETILNSIYKLAGQFDIVDLSNIKEEIKENGYKAIGYGRPLFDFMIDIINMASTGMDEENLVYLNLIKEMLIKNKNPKQKTIKQYMKNKNKQKSLHWCKLQEGVINVPGNTENV
ncbi:MAG: glutamate--cysteine ligase [Halanaerobiales bacterium]